jgi:rubrerythrin
LTGSTYFPCSAYIDIPYNYLDSLRERFLEENNTAQTYLDAAAITSNPRLSAMYREISTEELSHADEMASLISSYIDKI